MSKIQNEFHIIELNIFSLCFQWITIFLYSRFEILQNLPIVSGDQNVKNNFELLISVINGSRKEIGGNYHAEI